MSSLYADVSGRGGVLAAQMAVEDFGGRVLGAPIEVISGDHQNKPDVGAGIARQWIDADHVDAIVDVPTSSVALAVALAYDGQGRRLHATDPDDSPRALPKNDGRGARE